MVWGRPPDLPVNEQIGRGPAVPHGRGREMQRCAPFQPSRAVTRTPVSSYHSVEKVMKCEKRYKEQQSKVIVDRTCVERLQRGDGLGR